MHCHTTKYLGAAECSLITMVAVSDANDLPAHATEIIII